MAKSSDLDPSGECATSLTVQSVRELRGQCEARRLDVTATGVSGPIKHDFISAIYVYDMGLTDLENDLQDRIRILISWLTKKTIDEMRNITQTYFDLNCKRLRKKGDICMLVLEKVSQQPELPDIPDLRSLFRDLGATGSETSEEEQVPKPPRWSDSKAETVPKMNTVEDWVHRMAKSPAPVGPAQSAVQDDGRDALAGLFQKMKASDAPQVSPETKLQPTPSLVLPKEATRNDQAASKASHRHDDGNLDNVVQTLRDIAAMIEKKPDLAYLFAPALTKLSNSLGASTNL